MVYFTRFNYNFYEFLLNKHIPLRFCITTEM